jgi:hypothetical protein
MIYLKSAVVGMVTAIIFGGAWTWAALWIPMWWQMWQQRNQGGGGTAMAGVGSGSILLAALIGFILGFVLTMRRVAH